MNIGFSFLRICIQMEILHRSLNNKIYFTPNPLLSIFIADKFDQKIIQHLTTDHKNPDHSYPDFNIMYRNCYLTCMITWIYEFKPPIYGKSVMGTRFGTSTIEWDLESNPWTTTWLCSLSHIGPCKVCLSAHIKVKTQYGTLERPITKLCLLKEMTWLTYLPVYLSY